MFTVLKLKYFKKIKKVKSNILISANEIKGHRKWVFDSNPNENSLLS